MINANMCVVVVVKLGLTPVFCDFAAAAAKSHGIVPHMCQTAPSFRPSITVRGDDCVPGSDSYKLALLGWKVAKIRSKKLIH